MPIRTRKEWGAQPPKQALPRAPRRRATVFLHHSVTHGTGDEAMRTLQRVAFERGFSDVSYTRAVDANGVRYRGRRPGVEGAHTRGYNDTAHAICAIGNYDATEPSDKLLRGIAREIVAMRIGGALTRDCAIRVHRDVSSTACPGRHLVAAMPKILSYVERFTP